MTGLSARHVTVQIGLEKLRACKPELAIPGHAVEGGLSGINDWVNLGQSWTEQWPIPARPSQWLLSTVA